MAVRLATMADFQMYIFHFYIVQYAETFHRFDVCWLVVELLPLQSLIVPNTDTNHSSPTDVHILYLYNAIREKLLQAHINE